MRTHRRLLAALAAICALGLAWSLRPEERVASPAPVSAPLVLRAPTAPRPPEPADAGDAVGDDEDAGTPELDPDGLAFALAREDCDACDDTLARVPLRISYFPFQLDDEALDASAAWVHEARTDAHGELWFPDAGPGRYVAEILDPRFFSAPAEVDFEGGDQTYELPVSLVSTVRVKVLNRAAAPIVGAEVSFTFHGARGLDGVTDAHGVFAPPAAPSGLAMLDVSAPGFAPFHDEHVTVTGTFERTVELTDGRPLRVTVERAAGGPSLLVLLAQNERFFERQLLAPDAGELLFHSAPPGAVLVAVTEATGRRAALEAVVVPAARDAVTLSLGTGQLRVKVERPKPKSPWAHGRCCAPHAVALRCEGHAARTMPVDHHDEARFDFVPSVPCFVSYDEGPEARVWPGTVTLHVD